ncbi:MAG TPA: hypothetical protein VFV67_18920 [Actinophytocola sp.]|uniref:hypothetical protein n=1 Tax=Actinophytocola sp. TaxID=1872138 RepID=UPI002DBD6928|nr:hypothetical protein [Actinophytocola sp.]HEU5472725.1 hypothetical protein [Actinophytocola sp.]
MSTAHVILGGDRQTQCHPRLDIDNRLVTTEGSTDRARGMALETVHWHLVREDGQRTAVSTRAGAVLNTNTLVVAGTALAFSLKGSGSLSPWVFAATLGTLLLVAGSVAHATQALVMLRRTERRFSEPRSDASTLYDLSGISRRWPTFEQFRVTMMAQSAEQQLQGALDELW